MDRNSGTFADAARRIDGRPSVDEIIGELGDNGLVGVADDAGGGITAVVVHGRDGLVAVTRDGDNEYTVGMYHDDAWDGGEPTHFWTGVTLADVVELTHGTIDMLGGPATLLGLCITNGINADDETTETGERVTVVPFADDRVAVAFPSESGRGWSLYVYTLDAWATGGGSLLVNEYATAGGAVRRLARLVGGER